MKILNCLKPLVLIVGMLFLINTSFATIYHVSSSLGNDTNDGSESYPWKSIAKVNSVTFVTGDQILFKRGDKFYGTLAPITPVSNANSVTFGSYGSGNLPVITGMKAITGWTVHTSNIYKATFMDSLAHLFVDGKLMTIARYPNQGFLKIDQKNGLIGFYDAELSQSSNYWFDANCRIRTQNWQYETRRVSASSPGSITFASPLNDTAKAGYGYYLDNLYTILDTAGEWFYDMPGSTVYLYAPVGFNPSTSTAEGIVLNTGISLTPSRHYIKIMDLNITGYRSYGINANAANKNTTISGCTISYTGLSGILLSGDNELIDGNILTDNFNNAISGVLKNSLVSNNILKRTGMIAGYGASGIGCRGMQIQTSENTTVEFNTIDSTGYQGIALGKNMIVQKNILDYINLVMNDGAGISINDADGAQVKYNIITNVFGNVEASASQIISAHGITFQNRETKNILVQGNTVAYSRNDGIFVDNKNNSTNIQILDNVLYDNYITQLTITDNSSVAPLPLSYDNIVKRNVFYSLNFKQICMEHQMAENTNYVDFGTFDSNFYCNPYSEFVVRRSIIKPVYKTELYRLPAWQSKVNEDLTSRYSQFAFEQYRVTDTLDDNLNLILNPSFNTDISNWGSYPVPSSGGNTTIENVIHPLLDNKCLKNTWIKYSNPSECLTTSNLFDLSAGVFYLFSVSSANDHSGDFNAWVRYNVTGLPEPQHKKYLGFENYRREHSYLFKSPVDGQARMSIGQIDPDVIYVDNANLYKVSVDRIDSTQLSKLFINKTNSPQSFSLGGIAYKELDGSPVTGSIYVPAYSSKILIYEDPLFAKKFQLKALIEGLYSDTSDLMTPDTVSVYLRNFDSPYLPVDSSKSILNAQGNGTFSFPNATNGMNYYIVIKHRNAIETWSKTAVTFNSNLAGYDFTTGYSQAYGDNLKNKGIRYCLFSGDVNQDGNVDALDLGAIDNDVFNFVTGYVSTNLNNDYVVDAQDISIVDNNTLNFVSRKRPNP